MAMERRIWLAYNSKDHKEETDGPREDGREGDWTSSGCETRAVPEADPPPRAEHATANEDSEVHTAQRGR